MIEYIKKNPIVFCLIVALVLRFFSVAYSKGYMASDDHFETVKIAYQGIQYGLLDDNGHMRWAEHKPEQIGRSPLYVMSLYGIMKVMSFIGAENLDSAMYGVRLVHALLSLLPILFGMLYVQYATRNKTYVLIAGLILGAHFLMPYLSVRTLIEKVAEIAFVPGLYFCYRGTKESNNKLLMLSGLFMGLSWMIRFNLSIAILFIPVAILYISRSIKPVVSFCFGIGIMLVFSGLLDLVFLNRFGASSLNILYSIFYPVSSAPLPQPFYMFIGLILGILIPPFSIFFLGSFFKKNIMKEHLILLTAIAVFVIAHSINAHKEERFMIPIISSLIILGTIGLHGWLSNSEITVWKKKIFRCSAILAIVLNIILLPIFTLNYAHKGMVEPFVYLSRADVSGTVLIDRTERYRLLPMTYAGFVTPEIDTLDNWSYISDSLFRADSKSEIEYIIVYSDEKAELHKDSLEKYLGPIIPVFHSSPSTVDYLLNFLNPKHNHTNKADIYKIASPR